MYTHPTKSINYFNEKYFNEFIKNISSENKISYLSGDFNIDLLKIENDDSIKDFYNRLTSNLFVPHNTLPTRITSHSRTLIDNIFSNDPNFEEGVPGNFTFSISDHRLPRKYNLFKRDLKKYDKAELVADLINTNWPEILCVELVDPTHSYEMFNKKIKS